MKMPSHPVRKLLLTFLCAGVLGLWVLYDLPCPFRTLTGIICPGCGMARAWLCVLHLDFAGAFFYHPLFWVVPVLAFFLLYDCHPFSSRRLNTGILVSLAVAVFLCYAVRLILILSGTPFSLKI